MNRGADIAAATAKWTTRQRATTTSQDEKGDVWVVRYALMRQKKKAADSSR